MPASMLHVCFLLLLAVSSVRARCFDDKSWTKDKIGHTTCPKRNYILTGFTTPRIDLGYDYDFIGNLENGRCCSFPAPYSHDERNVVQADWRVTKASSHIWAMCPLGYFLSGFYRTEGNGINFIHDGRCTKPASAIRKYGLCYEKNTLRRSYTGSVKCTDGFFVTGILKKWCKKLYCLAKLKCCKLVPRPRVVDGLESAKLKVMDNTLVNMAELAHYLGYGWCQGCRAAFVGEDFRRDGDSWKADKTRRCSGTKWDHRLSIKYGDWKFTTKDIKFGKPEVYDLKPEILTTGQATNRFCRWGSRDVTYATSVARTVFHSPTSKWGASHATAISIVYQPTDLGGITARSAGYEFSYTDSSSTTDEKGEEQSMTYSFKGQKAIKPNSKLRWTAKLFKTRKLIPYTATILIHFSAELQGFLRYGGGYHGGSTNYYRGERGSKARKTKNFKFGGRETAFYTDLKQQEETRADPWMWGDLEAKHKSVTGIVKALVNEGRYEFTLSGQFDDIVPKDVRLEYEFLPLPEEPPKDLTDESKPTVHHIEARPTPEDEPSPVLKPPVVVIPDVPAKGIPDHIDIIDDGDTA